MNLSGKLDELLKGQRADFSGSVIDADEFREFILGIRNESCLHFRCCILNAVFEKKVDLRDGRCPDGSPLAALEFCKCTFHDGFDADGAHLERLKFYCCKFVAQENVDSVPWPGKEECDHIHVREADGQVKKKPRRPKNCISLRHCRIETELRLDSLAPCQCDGKDGVLTVDAFAARVGTNVYISDTTLRAQKSESSALSDDPHYALNLATATVGGDVQLMPNVVLEGGLKMRDAQVAGTFWARGFRATDGEDLKSRNTLTMRGQECRLAVHLETTDIQGNLMLSADSDHKFFGVVSLRNATIAGNVDLEADVNDIIYLDGLTVRGNLTASGEQWYFLGRQLTVSGNLIFTGRSVRGFYLDGTRITGNLVVSESRFTAKFQLAPQFVAKSEVLHCYEGWKIAEVAFYADNVQPVYIATFLVSEESASQKDSSKAVLLNGNSKQLHGFNDTTPSPLHLDTEEAAREYLKLFCASVWGELGSFAIIDKADALPEKFAEVERDQDRLKIPVQGMKIQDKTVGWIASAYVRYGEFLFMSEFNIYKNGAVTMTEDNPLSYRYESDSDKQKLVQFSFPYRIVDGNFGNYLSDFFGEHPSFQLINSAVMKSEIDSWIKEANSKQIELSDINFTSTASLTGATCKKLEDWRMPDTVPKAASEFRRGSESRRPELVWPKNVDIREFDYSQLSEGIDWKGSGLQRTKWALRRDATFSEEQQKLKFGLTIVIAMGLLMVAFFVAQEWPWPPMPKSGSEASAYLGWRMIVALSILIFVFVNARNGALHEKLWKLVMRFIDKKKPHPRWEKIGSALAKLRRRIERLTWRAEESNFQAQPLTHLAAVLRERGDDDAAKKVEAEKMWQEAVSRGNSSYGHWLALQLIWRPYGVMFYFGLSSGRALLTVILFWLLGWSSVYVLSSNGMLRANVERVAPEVLAAGNKPGQIALPKGANFVEADYSCKEEIEPALYAFELMTPIVNLHQESRCEIRSKPEEEGDKTPPFVLPWMPNAHLFSIVFSYGWFWEYAKAVYMLLGSIINSLALLTFSGIARRWEH